MAGKSVWRGACKMDGCLVHVPSPLCCNNPFFNKNDVHPSVWYVRGGMAAIRCVFAFEDDTTTSPRIQLTNTAVLWRATNGIVELV